MGLFISIWICQLGVVYFEDLLLDEYRFGIIILKNK